MSTTELIPADLRYIVQRLPKDIRQLMHDFPALMLGGGFIRATIAGEVPSDIDLFGPDEATLDRIAALLIKERPGSRIHKSKNAITLLSPNRMAVQFITRWTFTDIAELVASFDFTVCRAAIRWRNDGAWASCVSDRFYIDLAARRLVYTAPKREEEAGGSMLRVIKYVKRGYTIQIGSLASIMNRVFNVAGMSESAGGRRIELLTSILREVDPLLVVDGLEMVDDHETGQEVA